MKLKHLFLYIACFVVLSNYRSLFAHRADENIVSMTDSVNDNFMIFAEYICDLLLHGHSTDKVIAMLKDNQEHPYNTAKLVTQIQGLLNKQYSKDNVINIFVGNKESEKFYAQKNFWAKIKNSYFVLKATAIFVIIVTVFYLLYLLSQWFNFKIPWFSHKNQRADDGQESGSGKLTDHGKGPGSFAQAQKRAKLGQEQSHDILAQATQQTHQPNQDTLAQATQGTPQSSQNTQSDTEFDGSCYPDDEILDIDKLDLSLSRSILQQIEHARKIGLEPEVIRFDVTEVNREQRDDIILGGIGERFLQQIEYARSIGLNRQ